MIPHLTRTFCHNYCLSEILNCLTVHLVFSEALSRGVLNAVVILELRGNISK